MYKAAEIQAELQPVTDYSQVLDNYGVAYVADGYYWRVGEMKKIQGWIFDLSAIKCQIEEMANKVIPYLLQSRIVFKLIRDLATAGYLSSGTVGYENVGKILRIYPDSDTKLDSLAKDLINITQDFKGPAVPTDHYLGGTVYLGYGAHTGIAGRNMYGEMVNLIYDHNGSLYPEPLSIPFKVPTGVAWPLHFIKDRSIERLKRIINNKYYPISVIKPDVKGRVIKAIYLKSILKIKTALIKEGKHGMCDDTSGRDIIDRLKWQVKLHDSLKSDIPIPEIFDHFEENGDFFIAMNFVKGVSLHELKGMVFQKRAWTDLPAKGKLRLINQFINFIDVVDKMHSRGFIHRDINPGNVLIDPKDNMWLIDLELAWSVNDKYPTPAFGTGTEGFMSPEQELENTPDISQDIFSLGAFALDMCTNVHPIKFPIHSVKALSSSVNLFIDHDEMAGAICSCLSTDPSKRPDLATLKSKTLSFRAKIANEDKKKAVPASISMDQLSETIQRGLIGLQSSMLHDPNQGWFTLNQKKQSHIGNPQVEVNINPGWCAGNAGILWLLSRANRLGFELEHLEMEIANAWKHIENVIARGELPCGLFHGSDGIANLLSEINITSLLHANQHINQYVLNTLYTPMKNNGIADGWAGRGLTALKCQALLSTSQYSSILSQAAENVLKIDIDNKDISLELGDGLPGWGVSLTSLLKCKPSDQLKSKLDSLISYLIRSAKKKGKNVFWPRNNRDKTGFIDYEGTVSGNAGICLMLIDAFKITNDPKLKVLVEQNLFSLPPKIVMNNFCLSNGLAGLGEIYLEAYKTFKDSIWLERADWIVNCIIKLQKVDNQSGGYWVTDQSSIITGDLFNGNGGIIHLLLRRLKLEKLTHPLLM